MCVRVRWMSALDIYMGLVWTMDRMPRGASMFCSRVVVRLSGGMFCRVSKAIQSVINATNRCVHGSVISDAFIL